jgi:hypothetical protein
MVVALLLCAGPLPAQQVPQILSYQGRVAVGGINFDGQGQFKFSLVSPAGNVTYWSNDGTGTQGQQPNEPVMLTVNSGNFSVLLGDTTIPGMTAIPPGVFANADVRLRIWFNDRGHGFQLLNPDQRIAAVAYAIASSAAQVTDGSITTAKIAPGAVTNELIAPATIAPDRLALDFAIFDERAASGVGGASYAAGWNTRQLNTTGALGGNSISKGGGYTFVLNPGTYLVDAVSLSNQAPANQAAIFDVTNAAAPASIIWGTTDLCRISGASGTTFSPSLLKGYIIVTDNPHSFELRHFYNGAAPLPNSPSGSGLAEVYARVHIVRVR